MAKPVLKKRPQAKRRTPIVKRTRKTSAKKIAKIPRLQPKSELLGMSQTTVEWTKFSSPQQYVPARRQVRDLPSEYGKDKIVLQVRDTRWLHAYWEVTPATWERFKQKLGNSFNSAKRLLRVYDVSFIHFNGANAHSFFDIEVGYDTSNWYINTNGPGKSWCVDYGLKLANGEFITIIRSNVVQTPLDGPSNITDEDWMIPDDLFARLYGMGFGFGKSSPGKGWAERMKQALSSGGISSPTSPVGKPRPRSFWMILDCELIVYGATEPDAKVTVQGKEIKLRSDGTFSLRFALPDGRQDIPVKAVSADGIDERSATPVVTRKTTRSALTKERVK